MKSNKIRIIKDFDKLDSEIQEQIKLFYPEGFSEHLIQFTNKNGEFVSALPFETEDKIYMVRMSVKKAMQIIDDDVDYDDDGVLKDDTREKYEDKYPDLDSIQANYDGEDEDD
ncbi:MAG: hypothetical protein JXR51_11355 [Bacteroidales bacterium]|nr:hypothetical protein [Bacteroidales bacterium]MBN2757766.1 hypothetical protein [Bacteroidales bacterium]